jgi:putative addiction module component (TIGR02574 family)
MTLLERLFQEAEELPPEERERLAWMLMQSTTHQRDADAREFEAEIERRIALIDSGEAELIPWADVRRRLWETLGKDD